MLYIIDANNVAGKLKMLKQKNFDLKLIELFKEFNQEKNKEIELVFDGGDTMGDKKIVDNKLTVIYSPKDAFYSSADDKIVEMTERCVNREKKDITVVTDDNGLQKRIEELGERYNININLERATAWAEKLTKKDNGDTIEVLQQKDKDEINQELLQYWV